MNMRPKISKTSLLVFPFTKGGPVVISKGTYVLSQILALKTGPCQGRAKESRDRVICAVLAVARRIPTLKNCRVMHLTAKFFLISEGRSTALKTESAEGRFGQLKAHSWLEKESGLLIGSAEGDRYAAMPLSYGERK